MLISEIKKVTLVILGLKWITIYNFGDNFATFLISRTNMLTLYKSRDQLGASLKFLP